MAEYEILFKESVWKDLKKVPKSDLKRILSRVEKLGDDPHPMGCEKLTGEELYRVRQGNYRIVYSIQDKELTVWVIKVGHRKDVYR
ncbi:MAG: type II toxin-antitoxin system RelE/ParE family toxin [Candidatus Odinarchaeota archaeon]